jgi:hypothetical protein
MRVVLKADFDGKEWRLDTPDPVLIGPWLQSVIVKYGLGSFTLEIQ